MPLWIGSSDKPDALRDDLNAEFHAKDMQLVQKTCEKPPVPIGHDIGSYVLQCCATPWNSTLENSWILLVDIFQLPHSISRKRMDYAWTRQ